MIAQAKRRRMHMVCMDKGDTLTYHDWQHLPARVMNCTTCGLTIQWNHDYSKFIVVAS